MAAALVCWSAGLAQDRQAVAIKLDVLDYRINAEVALDAATLTGETQVRFKMLEDAPSLPFELNSRMSVTEIVDPQGGAYSTSFDGVDSARLAVRGAAPFQSGQEYTLVFRYEGTLERQEFAFLDAPRTEKAMIHEKGALLLSEGRWFPSYRLPFDAATATVRVSVPLGFSVVAPGRLQPTEISGVSEIFTWTSSEPISRIPVVVARFYRQTVDEPPVPLTLYVAEDQNLDDLKPLLTEVRQVLEFLEKEYGKYPHEVLTLAEAGNVMLPSTGAAGLVLLDSSVTKIKQGPIFELTRRLARLWWGYSVRPRETYDAWLQDAFAVYASLRYFESKYPDRFPVELAKQAVAALKYEQRASLAKGFDLIEGSPEYDSIVASKGAWVLYMLSQLIGRDKFNGFLAEWYLQNTGKAATTPDFVKFVQERTGQDYKWFFLQWVESTGVPDFRLDYTVYKKRDGRFSVRGQVRQAQELFKMPLDVLIETKGKEEHKNLLLNGKSTSFSFETETLPIRLKADPQGKILRDSEEMQIAVNIALGEEHQAKGEYGDALRLYEKARDLSPRSSLAHFRLGEVLFLQHSFSSAANSFREALNGDLKPDWVEAWAHIYLGQVYDINNNRERALAEYQKAINTKNDYNGAQAEAQKYLKEPYRKPQSVIG
jgi:aminopeptidase N